MPVLLRTKGAPPHKLCNAKCYSAKNPECNCICGGVNHQKGLEEATKLTSKLPISFLDEKGIELPPPKPAKAANPPKGNPVVDKDTGKVYPSLYQMGKEFGKTLLPESNLKDRYVAFKIMSKFPDRFERVPKQT